MFYRICFRDVREIGHRVRIDLQLDKDHKPVQNMTYFGFWGSMNFGGQGNGVLLNTDGELDLGFTEGFTDRYHKTNILEKKMTVGQYVTVWWHFDGETSESVHVVEGMTQLSAITELVSPKAATHFHVPSLDALPRFRARVRKSFDITGYDNTTYRPPIGVEGDVAIFQDKYVLCPDDAIAKSGVLITAFVDQDDIELLNNVADMTGAATG